jgi:hypothetical protein
MTVDEIVCWRCYFTATDGTFLRTVDGWSTEDDAELAGEQILERPEEFELVDPDGFVVPANDIDTDVDFTVEASDDLDD